MSMRALAAAMLAAAALVGPAWAARTNVILIVSDDGGYAEYGFQRALSGVTNGFLTPNLDALAARSVVFPQGYVSGAVCSPSRAGFLLGRYQQRIGYEYNISNDSLWNDGMPTRHLMLPERFKQLGYTTGVIGKWHMGSEPAKQPQSRSVDEFYGLWGGSRPYFQDATAESDRVQRLRRNANPTNWWAGASFNGIPLDSAGRGRYLTDAFGDEMCRFVADHAADTNGFFLYMPFTTPHGPYDKAKQQDIDVFTNPAMTLQQRKVAAMIYALDRAVGFLSARLEDPNDDGNTNDSIAARTVLAFFVDNGGATTTDYDHDNAPLRGYKSTAWEGGVRVPFFLRLPGVAAGVYSNPVISLDLFPTFMASVGAPMTTPSDGVDLRPYLDGRNTNAPHAALFWRQGGLWAARQGDWKLCRGNAAASVQLYQLNPDGTGEFADRSAAEPAKVQELLRLFTAWDVRNDKPRWSSDHAANYFDLFHLRPDRAARTGTNLLANGGFEFGAQADTNAYYTFAELDAWTDDGVESGDVAARNDTAYQGAYRGMLSISRWPQQITSHPLVSGEVFSIRFAHLGSSGWDDGASPDQVAVDLVYLDGGGVRQVLSTCTADPSNGVWMTAACTFPAVSAAGAVGRPVGVRFRALAQSNEFASIDEVELYSETAGRLQARIDWDAAGAWVSSNDWTTACTLMPEDAYANAVLQFPAYEDADYTARNTLARQTGLDFVLNDLRLTGGFTGAVSRTATVMGNRLLLVRNLDDMGPWVRMSSVVSNGAAGMMFRVDTDLALADDLTLIGNGNASFLIRGRIADYDAPRSLIKTGTATVVLGGSNSYAGATWVRGGHVAVDGGAIAGSSNITVEAGATLTLSNGLIRTPLLSTAPGGRFRFEGGVLEAGAVAGGLQNRGGEFRPGLSIAAASVGGSFTQFAAGTLRVELGGLSPGFGHDQVQITGGAVLGGTIAADLVNGFDPPSASRFVILTCAARSGVFATTALPAMGGGRSWVVRYAPTSVELRVVTPADSDGDGVEDAWELAHFSDLEGTDGGDADADGDGFTDAQEWQVLTSPTDSNDYLRLSIQGPAAPDLVVSTASGVTYRLYRTDALAGGMAAWSEYTNFPGVGRPVTNRDPTSTGLRYYRVGAGR